MTPDSVPSTLLPLRHVLSNGLQVGFIQLPTGSQAAALVRVHAGAHDAPSQYPGLAHFLEHLLFLGSHAYGPSQSLMPFVQGCAGLLNASTRERHTDFFFQVSPAAFDEALKRLLDMLARPLLDPAAQRGNAVAGGRLLFGQGVTLHAQALQDCRRDGLFLAQLGQGIFGAGAGLDLKESI